MQREETRGFWELKVNILQKLCWKVSVCVRGLISCAHLITDGLTTVNVASISWAKIPRKWETELIKLLLQFAQILSNGLTAN